MMRQIRSVRRAAVLLVAALATTACLEDALEHEAEVDFMRVTVDGTAVTVNSTGAITGGPISITSGTAASVTVEFLDADMNDAIADHADDYQADITTPAGITFTRTGPFAGTLSSPTPATYNVQVSLFHIEESHTDFGAFGIPITVTAPAATARTR